MRTELWLHEELLLLSLEPERGTIPWQAHSSGALIGAALTELLATGRVRLEKKGRSSVMVFSGRSALGDPLLDELLERIRTAPKPRTVATWLATFSGLRNLTRRITERLWYRGYLRQEVKPFALVFSRPVYPVARLDVRDRIVTRLRDALQNTREPEPRDAALLALLKHMGRLPALFDAAARKQHRARIKQIVKIKTPARPVPDVLAAVEAALAST